MTTDPSSSGLPIVPREMRREQRADQIENIRAEVKAAYVERIRAATTRAARRALKTERDAEIAREPDALTREDMLDGPYFL